MGSKANNNYIITYPASN